MIIIDALIGEKLSITIDSLVNTNFRNWQFKKFNLAIVIGH